MAQGSTPEDALSLLDWKRRVLELYAGIRADADPERPGSAGARRAGRAVPHPPPVAAARRRARRLRGPRLLRLRPGRPRPGRGRSRPSRSATRSAPAATAAYAFTRFGEARVRAGRRGAVAGALLAGGIRRRRLPPGRRRDQRQDHLRGRPLRARHRQGRRPGRRTTAWCSTSTSPTTPRAPTTRPGSARWLRLRTGFRFRSRRGSAILTRLRATPRRPPSAARFSASLRRPSRNLVASRLSGLNGQHDAGDVPRVLDVTELVEQVVGLPALPCVRFFAGRPSDFLASSSSRVRSSGLEADPVAARRPAGRRPASTTQRRLASQRLRMASLRPKPPSFLTIHLITPMIESGRRDLNPLPRAWEARALPGELRPRGRTF